MNASQTEKTKGRKSPREHAGRGESESHDSGQCESAGTSLERGGAQSRVCEETPSPRHAGALSCCPGCGNPADPEICWCGDDRAFHGPETGHSFVPAGCTCGFSRLPWRAAARALKRLKEETVIRPSGPISHKEWRRGVDIIVEEMTRLTKPCPTCKGTGRLRGKGWAVKGVVINCPICSEPSTKKIQ